ncbi:YorP-like protein [Bacillus phage Kirov]|uniref:YorP-like protein n=1 Tax=Bacillus phage Kirov TaxID=2783539 RepID=A0A7U3NKH8_9CAUD|nr:YorP-like protein [Bacillus phage Kirov]QOV08287.1 YorP-like protein [Bacillus phage Kirov]
MQPTYEVGEVVRIINDLNGHLFEIGQLVKVKALHYHGGVASAESLDGEDYWYLNEDDIEKVEQQ